MITLLSRLFIRNSSETTSPQVRTKYGMLCGLVGIFLNLLLFAGKFLAGLISHSIAITADAFNNLSDAGSSIITLIGFKLANEEPDPDHPFGHGRIEYLAGLIVSCAIILMAFELIRDSISKIIHPVETEFSYIIIFILVASILVKIYMFYYNNGISKKINSAAMKATAMDSLSDSVATSVVLITTLLSHFFAVHIDAWCGVLVGLLILYAGFEAAKDTVNPLLGQPADSEFVKEIEDLVMAHKEILGIHDLIVHDYGPGRVMISLHAEVDSHENVLVSHDIIDNIEFELHDKLKCSATIHMDPVETDNPLVNELKEKTAKILNKIDDTIRFHDFRIVTGPTHTNIIYDVVVPFKYKYSDDELVAMLKKETTNEIGNTYFVVVNVDKNYA